MRLVGDDLEDLAVADTAASVRLLLPRPGEPRPVIPDWNGNEFLMDDGTRPVIRTLTPLERPEGSRHLDVDVVLHNDSPLTEWARDAAAGTGAAVSGPGRGCAIDDGAAAYLVVGDESAIPAMRQVIAAIPSTIPVRVHVEIASADAETTLSSHARARVAWHVRSPQEDFGGPILDAVRTEDLVDGTVVWAAGEAAAMQRIRRHLADERRIPRTATTVRGYWKKTRRAD